MNKEAEKHDHICWGGRPQAHVPRDVMDEQGNVLKQEKFLNREDEFVRVFEGIDDAKVAIEATSCWQPAYEMLEDLGYEVKLAHP